MKFSFSFHKNEKRPNGTLQLVEKGHQSVAFFS